MKHFPCSYTEERDGTFSSFLQSGGEEMEHSFHSYRVEERDETFSLLLQTLRGSIKTLSSLFPLLKVDGKG
jgi:hypothetical protein